MSLADEHLHHPRPLPGRRPPISSGPTTSNSSRNQNITHPHIQYQYPTTPVPRPPAPRPSRPNLKGGNNGNSAARPVETEQHLWNGQPMFDGYQKIPSPTDVRWEGHQSSQNVNPSHVDGAGMRYPESTRIAPHSMGQSGTTRQRSASSPEHLQGYGAYDAYNQNDVPPVPISALAFKPNKPVGGSVHFTPDNLFLSLASSDTLKIYNLTPSNNGPNLIMDVVRRSVLTSWPKGLKLDDEGRGEWTVRFNGAIWNSKGSEAIIARRMICRLFDVLAMQGYSYLSTIQTTHPFRPSSHLFSSSAPCRSRFFSLSFSLNKRKLTLMDAPPDLNVTISNALKNATLFDVEEIDEVNESFGNEKQAQTEHEETDEDYDNEHRVYTYRLTKRRAVTREKDAVQLFLTRNEKADILMLLSQLLKIIATSGFRLDASLPLGSVGPFGLFGKREMWIFKEVPWKGKSRRD